MEILGAIASSIALTQAVKGTLKAVDFLRQNSDMKKECEKLRKEILMIDCFIMQAREQTGQMMSAHRLLGIAEHPLVPLTIQELNEIAEKYSRSRKAHDPKRYTDKVKWFSDASKIEELQERAQATKSNLHMAITFRVSSMVDRGNVRQETHNISQTLPKLLQGPHPKPENSTASLQPATEGTTIHHKPESPTTEENRVTEDSKMSSISTSDRSVTTIKEESFVSVTTIQPLSTNSCGSKCQCRCHRGQRNHAGTWAGSLFYSWLVRYGKADNNCQSRCRCKSSIEYEFRLPNWLWAGVRSSQASRRPTVTFSLHLSRVLKLDKSLWMTMANPSLLETRIREGFVYFPDDTAGNGWPLLLIALSNRSSDCVEILLKLWENILPSQGLSRDIGYRLTGFQAIDTASAIDKALSFVQDWEEVSTTKVHTAAAEGGVLGALREQPWAINELNEYGKPPIHVAVMTNNFEGLEQLIAAEADINRQDYFRRAPLMRAARNGNDTMVQTLLGYSECRRLIGLKDVDGETALHFAVESGSPACVILLLEAGASASKLDIYGQTPMHRLTWANKDEQEIDEIIELLQARGADIESKNNYGLTPTLGVCQEGNVPVLRALIRAGASIGTIDSRRRGILHLATISKNFDVVNNLAQQDLEGIDPQLRDLHCLKLLFPLRINKRTSSNSISTC
ncbi:Ankyrin repeat, PH and SEC7 domain containing protein secG [Fusarium oxysporum f. sp. rapae]|uniref:Ankyrin repeat, PH and SEC7 domain containing protein secG n=1 Tax=Fusarium oxysporum f. sp. rapae TaxID=485398 RepID=A0A8J5UEJ9_FUSOX|nr:Ankyrin repeat, PH and SEC7 domain containing protein secG [Fusarium oxysporum f. sp. rapae]